MTSFTLGLPDWIVHRAGQHYDVRLTAADGYQAERSYSIASEPEREDEVELTIERVPDGEVSGWFHEVVVVGDLVELRGPIGGYFAYTPSDRPLLLVAGGSGVVPLMAMLRHGPRAATVGRAAALSAREPDEVVYATELEAPLRATASSCSYPHAAPATRLDRVGAPDRPRDAGPTRPRPVPAAAGLRVRADGVRRASRNAARRRRPRPGRDPCRALRTHRRMR